MSKGNNRRGNKESKKPKQPKKPPVTASPGSFDKGISPGAGLGAKKKS
jgi:hypothetical protein